MANRVQIRFSVTGEMYSKLLILAKDAKYKESVGEYAYQALVEKMQGEIDTQANQQYTGTFEDD